MAIRATNELIQAGVTTREWFTAAELAEMNLPGLPTDKRGINRRAREENWHLRCDRLTGELLVRPSRQRGGGNEYHVSLLPGPARMELARRGVTHEAPQPAENRDAGGWAWFDGQSAKVQSEAARRLAIIQAVELLQQAGETMTSAIATVAAPRAGASTILSWFSLLKGVARTDRLPALAPRRKGGGAEADIDPELWHIYKSDVLRPEEPRLTLCYENIVEIAEERGLSVPSERTFRRRLAGDVDPRIIKRLRKGAEASRRSLPAQRRTVDHLHALECVNIDGHKFDVFVESPWARDKDGKPKRIRPILVGIQDVRSSKIVAYRVCEVESAHHVRLVFADLFRDHGIPLHAVLDNGRGFASKWITGGMANRFRFKVLPSDPVGLLTGLDVKVHWALPYHGQSKPIERAWKDLTDRIARHAFVAGAYTGNSPVNKPENYGKRAVPWADFLAHVDQQVAKHNAKLGRTGRDYKGRSFDQVFAESMATAPIGKAGPEQLRRALLAGEQKLVNKDTGVIEIYGNRYWSEACSQLHGQRVTVRFDPDDLSQEIHLYAQDGRYLTSAQCWADVGFLSADDANKTAKFVAEQKRKIRDGVEAEDLLTAAQVAAYQTRKPVAVVPEPTVIRPVRHRGATAAALKPRFETMPLLPTEGNKVLSLFGRLQPED